MCLCRLILGAKCPMLVSDVGNGGGCTCMGTGHVGYFNLCYKPKTALKMWNTYKCFFLKKKLIYFEREGECVCTQGRDRERGRIPSSAESDVGLDLNGEIMTWAKIKSQVLNRLNHPGVPKNTCKRPMERSSVQNSDSIGILMQNSRFVITFSNTSCWQLPNIADVVRRHHYEKIPRTLTAGSSLLW